MTELHFFEGASDEAEEARRWYRERSEAAETAFLIELDHAIALVVEAPNRWPKHIAGTRRYVFPTFPYSLVYFIEYDHLILSAEFEARLAALADRSPAGLFAKHAGPRNDTNWPHFARFRHDEPFNRFVAQLSRRDDPERRFGALGNGMLFRREALEAYCAVGEMPHAYVELVVPTVVYHLGFDVVDVDAISDLYAAVRWRPEYTVDEALAARAAGRVFVHPFKQLELLPTGQRAKSSTADSRG